MDVTLGVFMASYDWQRIEKQANKPPKLELS